MHKLFYRFDCNVLFLSLIFLGVRNGFVASFVNRINSMKAFTARACSYDFCPLKLKILRKTDAASCCKTYYILFTYLR